jgi:hypothetical protein
VIATKMLPLKEVSSSLLLRKSKNTGSIPC